MNQANRNVVESNIPSAAPVTPTTLKSGMTRQQEREREDINDWLCLQEDAELAAIQHEYANKRDRQYRNEDWSAYC